MSVATPNADTATTPTTTDLTQAQRSLKALPPQLYVADRPDAGCLLILRDIGPTTLVAIRPDSGMDGAAWLDETTLPSAASWAVQRNGAGANLYFTLNEPSTGLCRKAAKSDIRSLRGIGADIDAKDGRSLEDARVAIGGVPSQPSLIIMSGGGWQPLWLFEAPVRATQEAVGRTIAQLTGGDAVQNVDRVYRLPFTVNYPNKRKREQGRTACLSGIIHVQGGQQ
jgi:hypothetical protein